jgi:hypothetical protein
MRQSHSGYAAEALAGLTLSRVGAKNLSLDSRSEIFDGDEEEMMMTVREQYAPGPASGAQVEKGGEKWTLILVRELRHPPEKVWPALTDPAQLREWAPFVVDGSLGAVGTVNLTWAGNPKVIETKVTRADAPRLLEYGDLRWELEPLDSGTRLTLWIKIDRRFIAWGAAGWHICFDVLDHLLDETPIGRIVAGEAIKFGFQRLNAEYAQQFGVAVLEVPAKFIAQLDAHKGETK